MSKTRTHTGQPNVNSVHHSSKNSTASDYSEHTWRLLTPFQMLPAYLTVTHHRPVRHKILLLYMSYVLKINLRV